MLGRGGGEVNVKFTLALAAIAVITVLGASTWLMAGQVREARAQRDAAFDSRDAAFRAIDELAIERARADLRYQLVLSSRESILAAPAADDGAVAPVLWQGLQAADQIGGIE